MGPPTGLVPLLHAHVPVTPDAPTARRWAEDELARPEYHAGNSLLQRLLEWFERFSDASSHLGLPPGTSLVVGAVLVALVVLVVLRYAGPVRRTKRVRTERAVLDDDTRTAAQLRAAADDAVRAGAWDTALVERFRAVVRSLEERAVLDERPGRTADEAALDAAPLLPGHAAGLAGAARVFDDVLYGDRRATAADHDAVRALDESVRAARVSRPRASDGPGGGPGDVRPHDALAAAPSAGDER